MQFHAARVPLVILTTSISHCNSLLNSKIFIETNILCTKLSFVRRSRSLTLSSFTKNKSITTASTVVSVMSNDDSNNINGDENYETEYGDNDNKNYYLLNVSQYLDEIQEQLRLLAESDDSKNESEEKNGETKTHIISDVNNNHGKIKAKVTESHRKIMMRTLLKIPDSKEFNNNYRKAENQIRIKSMVEFIINHFHPALSIDQHSILMNTAPHYHDCVKQIMIIYNHEDGLSNKCSDGQQQEEDILFEDSTDIDNLNTHKMLSKMARGPFYRGKFISLMEKVTPQLIPLYNKMIVDTPSEKEIYHSLIDTFSNESSGIDKNILHKCIECNLLPSLPKNSSISDDNDTDDEDSTAVVSTIPTKSDVRSCENLCIQFLQDKTQFEQNNNHKNENYQCKILKNVFIKTPKSHKKNHLKGNNKPIIISTTIEDGLSTEFDAIVLKEKDNNNHARTSNNCTDISIKEVWEAKYTLSPSSIVDAITKKFRSMQLIAASANDLFLATTDSRKFSQQNNQTIITNDKIEYGIFGLSVLTPKHAAIQLRNIECSRLLANDVDSVLYAIDYGYVMLNVNDIIQKSDRMRADLDKVHVIVHGSCGNSNYSRWMMETVDVNGTNCDFMCNPFYNFDSFSMSSDINGIA